MTSKQRASSSSSRQHHRHHSERESEHGRSSGDAKVAGTRKHKKRSSEFSRHHDRDDDTATAVESDAAMPSDSSGAWESFTSPDGRTYYYNKITQESRWKLPKELRKAAAVATKPQELAAATAAADTDGSVRPTTRTTLSPREEVSVASERRQSNGSVKPTDTLVSSSGGSAKKNELVQRLQASLAGRININPMANMGPPPMIHIPRGESITTASSPAASFFAQQAASSDTSAGNGGASDEQQYEAETAHMTAAERLRFLRKKRQETMFAKEKIVEEDDFMKEFERNMTKKHDGKPDWRQKREQEQAKQEKEREKQKRREKEKEEQEVAERQQRKEREEAEEREREAEEKQRRQREEEDEREREKQQQQEEELTKEKQARDAEKTKAKKKRKEAATERKAEEPSGENDTAGVAASPPAHDEESEDNSAKVSEETADDVGAGKVLASVGSEISVVQREAEAAVDSTDKVHHEENGDRQQDKQRRKQRKHSKSEDREEPPNQQGNGDVDGGEQKSVEDDDAAAAVELERQRLKHEKHERRRIAKLEAELAAQSLESSPVKKSKKKSRKQSAHDGSEANGYQHQQQQAPPFSGGGMYPYPPPYGYPLQPHPMGGMCTCCRPHPFVPVHVPPPPTSFPMYYPYAQGLPPPPPPMMMMMGAPPMLLQSQPPLSQPGMMATALVPFTQGQLTAYGYGGNGLMAGNRAALERCEGCRGAGVGLVEKNGFCNHCNRLRLDFIVASARIRQRCSVCGGWGLGLVQANGKCAHCSRGAQSSARSVARRQSVGEHQLPPGAVATPFASEILKRTGSASRAAIADEKEKSESVDWDASSSDNDSEWDD